LCPTLIATYENYIEFKMRATMLGRNQSENNGYNTVAIKSGELKELEAWYT
jgi:hypothetical protein